MSTVIHAMGYKLNKIYRVYGPWGERQFPKVRTKNKFYQILANELRLPLSSSRKEIVFALLDKSWNGRQWTDDFRLKLKAARQERGFTQAQLAERAGLSLVSIRTLEQGIRSPRTDTIRRLAVVLQIDTSELIGVPKIDPASETHNVLFT